MTGFFTLVLQNFLTLQDNVAGRFLKNLAGCVNRNVLAGNRNRSIFLHRDTGLAGFDNNLIAGSYRQVLADRCGLVSPNFFRQVFADVNTLVAANILAQILADSRRLIDPNRQRAHRAYRHFLRRADVDHFIDADRVCAR